MRFFRLELCGIGPYSGTEQVNVQALGENGLFLLEGPTGSGKTTIIDALVFALYGQVSGADSSSDRLASTHLPPEVEPYVDLVVDTSRGIYRVRRTPKYERPKKRGTGTTTQNATARLWKLSDPTDEQGTPVSSNVQEASAELRGAIGLTLEQFTQTVVLPQGQFATFLRAKAEERREVLQQIFGTQVYENMAEELRRLAREHSGAVQAAREQVVASAHEFIHAAWPAPDAGQPPGGDGALDDLRVMTEAVEEDAFSSLDRLARQRLALLRAHRAQLATDSEAADAAAAAARDAAQQGRQLAADRERHARLLREQTEHTALAASVEGWRQRAKLAERAGRCIEALRADDAASAHHEAAAEAWRQAAVEQAGLLDEPLPADPVGPGTADAETTAASAGSTPTGSTPAPGTQLAGTRAALAEARSRVEQASGALAELVALEQSLPGRRAAAEGEEAQVRALTEQLAEARQEQDDRARRREEAEEQAAGLAELAETLADASSAQQVAASRLEAALSAEKSSKTLARARRKESTARQAAETAREEHRSARSRWLDSLAGELAGELTVDGPCPVCGSLTHPHPASRPEDAPTRNDVEQLAETTDTREKALSRATTKCNTIAARLAEQQDRAGQLTAAEAREAVSRADEAVTRATDAVTRRRQLGATVERLRTEADKATDRISALTAEQARLAESVRAAQDRLREDAARLEQAREGAASVTERASSLRARIDAIDGLQEALDRFVETRQARQVTRQSAHAALAREAFTAGPAQVHEAVLPEAELAALTGRIREYDERTAELRTQLADERLEAAARAQQPDLEALDAEAARAEEAAQRAQRLLGELGGQLTQSEQAADRLAGALTEHGRIGPRAEPYIRMSELANATGNRNLLGVTLPAFVLRHRFEQVIDRANERLEEMTHGRYSLRRTDDREGRSRRQGLGLVVVDHVLDDTERDPRTLSGGETFLASLAMALGLSDTVTSEAGGIELGSLFVDEGFGSLDPDALDMVMSQLERLRADGRCVGVISHVAEMKQRIAERVSVRPRGDGTSTLTTTS